MNKTQMQRGMDRSGIVRGGIDGKLGDACNSTRHSKSGGQRRQMEGAKEMTETRKHKGLIMLPGNGKIVGFALNAWATVTVT